MKELLYETVKSSGIDPMTLAFFVSVGISSFVFVLMKSIGTFWLFQAMRNPNKAAIGYGLKQLANGVSVALVFVCFLIIVWILNQVGFNIKVY